MYCLNLNLNVFQDACVSTEDDDFDDMDDESEASDEPRVGPTQPSRLSRVVDWLDGLFDRLLVRIFRKYSPNIVNMYIYSNTLGT